MSAIDEMIKKALAKMLTPETLSAMVGPQMPDIIARVNNAISRVNGFAEQLDRIEAVARDNNERLTLIMAGGHSISERIEMGLGIIQDTDLPLIEMIGAAEHAGHCNHGNAPGGDEHINGAG